MQVNEADLLREELAQAKSDLRVTRWLNWILSGVIWANIVVDWIL